MSMASLWYAAATPTKITERSRIVSEGKTYQVLGETLHVDYQTNIVQFNAQIIINDKNPLSSSSLAGGPVTASEL